jgi:Tol biopolymer transport system component
MPLGEGTRLGRYEIRSKIGEGGMGEVYRAYDPAMHREVAIKLLPAELSTDKGRLARFEQEAQTAGALNHPNILVIHHIETHEGAPYIVSELLEGETLRQRLGGSALAQRRAIDYANQIAHGLAAAHEKGIVHRDLKPDNIFLTKDGRVKILDFGIAKLTQPEGYKSQTEIPTRRVDTDPGTVMGTVGYMSPEQVKGRPVDHRSDIFSFGAILYEMLSGRRAFHGESAAETMSAILKEDPPDLSQTNQNISPALERLVNHCLEKNPEARFHSARDLAFALEAISGSSPVSGQTMTAMASLSSRERIRKFSPWIVAAIFALAFLVTLPFVFLYFRRPTTQALPAAVRFLIPLPEKADYLQGPVISPDGRLVVFAVRDASGKESLWTRPLDALDAHPLTGTELGGEPFWSPDSRTIGFFAGGKLKKIDVSGGPVQTLCDAPLAAGGTWNRDGVIVFGRNFSAGLYRVPSTGGTPTPVTTLDKSRNELIHLWPQFLPDGRHFLFLTRVPQEGKNAIFVGSLDSKETKLLLNADSSVAYAPPGYLLFQREQTLMAQAFDAGNFQLTGEAVPIAERIGRTIANARAFFSVSETGVLVYRSQVTDDSQLVWFDRAGKQLGTVGPSGIYAAIRLSPDEKRVALQRLDAEKGSYDIWLIELAHGTPTRLTFDPASDIYAVWSPDGSRIVFASNREGTSHLYQKPSSGGGSDELLFKSDYITLPNDWSPDGRYILYQELAQKDNDLWVLAFEERKPTPFLQTDFAERFGRFSPDGRWIAYVSNESGKSDVYVRTFPDSGGKWQISNAGGTQPHWRRDGKELFYVSPDKKLMAVEVNGSSGTFEVGIPKPLFDLRIRNTSGFSDYDVTADGQRFLVSTLVEQNARSPVTVVMNWMADLKK